MKYCIYQILNLANNKFYIGHSQDYDIRWWEHERRLRTNRHENPHLQAAWNKHGKDNFEFILIELVEEKYMLEREQYWINKLGACDNLLGYNINPDGGRKASGLGKKRTLEQRARMSAAMTGIPKRPHIRRPRTEEHKKNIGMSKKDIETWPCPDGYYCGCDICRPKRNRMKNYPHIYGNPNSPLYKK